jgi:hypothetical protein
MCAHDQIKRLTANSARLGSLALGLSLLGFVGPIQAVAQNTAAQTHVVTVRSDPPGAMIWKKEGRDYTCTKALTPSTVELAFHGDNDLQRLRLRRFGYRGVDLDVKPTDKEVAAALDKTYSSAFLSADSDAPDQKQLAAALKKEIEQALLTDGEAFRCAPYDLDDISVIKGKEAKVFILDVNLRLDRSFGGVAFRQASHAFDAQGRQEKMGQIALDSGIAEVLVRFHRIADKFPEVQYILVDGSYTTNEARLNTEKIRTMQMVNKYVAGQPWSYSDVVPVWHDNEYHVVKNQDVKGAITFIMPNAQIPDTLDKKITSAAVLAGGRIVVSDSGDER